MVSTAGYVLTIHYLDIYLYNNFNQLIYIIITTFPEGQYPVTIVLYALIDYPLAIGSIGRASYVAYAFVLR